MQACKGDVSLKPCECRFDDEWIRSQKALLEAKDGGFVVEKILESSWRTAISRAVGKIRDIYLVVSIYLDGEIDF